MRPRIVLGRACRWPSFAALAPPLIGAQTQVYPRSQSWAVVGEGKLDALSVQMAGRGACLVGAEGKMVGKAAYLRLERTREEVQEEAKPCQAEDKVGKAAGQEFGTWPSDEHKHRLLIEHEVAAAVGGLLSCGPIETDLDFGLYQPRELVCERKLRHQKLSGTWPAVEHTRHPPSCCGQAQAHGADQAV